MKLTRIVFVLLLVCCNQAGATSVIKKKISSLTGDKEQIQNLIRQVYNWHEARKPSNNDMVIDKNGSIYIGFNLDQLKLDIDELKSTNFFSVEFIDNYNKIYRTLDSKLRSKELEWSVGDLPPFGDDGNPWCNCQDIPYDTPNPWDLIEIEIIALDNKKGELIWKWGKLELNNSDGWKEFHYKFRVVKEDGKWRISYLEGFDFDTITRKNY